MNREYPTIVISNRMFQGVTDLIAYGRRNGCRAVDYSFSKTARVPKDITDEEESIRTLLENGFQLRYHTPFFHQEIASADKDKAAHAVRMQKECIDLAAAMGGTYLTLHIGLGMRSIEDLDYDTALAGLSELVDYGAGKGLTVCLENLTKGFTVDPERFLEMLDRSGAAGTFDLGHANACSWVEEGRGTSLEFLGHVIDRIHNAHIYEIERTDPETGLGYHVAPQNLDRNRMLLEALRGSDCDWWLIELNTPEDVDLSLQLLRGFLDETEV